MFYLSSLHPGRQDIKRLVILFKSHFCNSRKTAKKFPVIIIIINFKLLVACWDDRTPDKLHTGEL